MNRERELENLIRKHKSCYYQGTPTISDLEYDKLEDELRVINPSNQVLQIVGSKVKGKKIKHDKKMLSLGKTYVIDDLLKWKLDKKLCATKKIDGNSCSLIYKKGKLTLAKTRGDGEFGEDITDNVIWVKSLPLNLSKISENIEIRGELFCTEEKFLKLSDEMCSRDLDKPTSPRNIVAGLLGRKDNLDLNKHIDFMAFDLIIPSQTDNLNFKTEEEKFIFLKRNNFLIPDYSICESEKDIKNIINESYLFFNEGNYAIDGIVFTYNNLKLHDELGYTAHHPKFKLAYKFKGTTKETTILNIDWQVSRNGVLTPVAKVEPVDINGANISSVTLHNWGLVHTQNLKIEDKIEIIRSGEVIPKYLKTIKESNNSLSYPEVCPSCNQKTKIDGVWLICENSKCPLKIEEEILYFIKSVGIEDLSKKRLQQLMKLELVLTIDDLYKLEQNDLLKLENFKEKLSSKIIKSINSSKTIKLEKFLTALGIKGGGLNKCELIINNGYDSIEKIQKLTIEKLIEIDGFAALSAGDFLLGLKDKQKLISKLIYLGFKFKKVKKNSQVLEGISFCITGTLTRKRSEIVSFIKYNGGVVRSSVSKGLNFLITNDTTSNSSKLKNAQKFDVTIISEEKLYTHWDFN